MTIPRRVHLVVQPRIPGAIAAVAPLSATRTGRDYSVSIAPLSIAALPSVTDTSHVIAVNPADGSFSRGPIKTGSLSDFNTNARAQVESMLVAGANVSLTPAGSGASRTITVAAAGGAGALAAPNVLTNCTISASAASSALTIALKTAAGSDPSGASSTQLPFRSSTAGSGVLNIVEITTSLSFVVSSGSTLGVPAINTPFALWVVAFDDAGTIRLGVINCRSGSNIFPLGRTSPRASSTAEGGSGAADSAHVFYTGTAVATKAYCILGRLEWSSGLATLGAWTAPTSVESWHPHIKLPGDIVQIVHGLKTDTFTSTTSGSYTDITGLSASIAPTSAANLVKASPRVQAAASGGNGCQFVLIRGSTNIGSGDAAGSRIPGFSGVLRSSDNASTQTLTAIVLDAPASTSSTTYKVQFVLQGGTLFVNRSESDADLNSFGRYSSSVTLEEIQC